MIRRSTIFLFLLAAAAGLPVFAAQETGPRASDDQKICATALAVIEKNLDAVGGKEQLRKIESMIIKGVLDSLVQPAKRKMTVYVKKPDKMKQEGVFSVLLCNGEQFTSEIKGRNIPLDDEMLEEIRYRIGFFQNGFSLLKWESLFPVAELQGIKKYGPLKQYEIRFPEGQNGHDLFVYIDTETFLIDRLVFKVSHAKTQTLKTVNRLRDYKSFHGILFPTFISIVTVGWNTVPTQYTIRDVKINPGLDDAVFADTSVGLGTVVSDGATLTGEALGKMQEGYILTNFREDDLKSIQIRDKDRLNLRVGGKTVRITYLEKAQLGIAKKNPEEIYLCRYALLDYPRLVLFSLENDLEQSISCLVGDPLELSRVATSEK